MNIGIGMERYSRTKDEKLECVPSVNQKDVDIKSKQERVSRPKLRFCDQNL